MRIGAGVHAAGDGACFFYDGHSHPFLRLRGGTHPLARRTCEPPPLDQAGQIRPVPPAGAVNLGPGRRIVSQDSPDGVSRLGGQAGTQAPDPTPVLGQDRGSLAGSTYPQSPCRLGAARCVWAEMDVERRSTRSEWTGRSPVPWQRWCGSGRAGESRTGFRPGSVAVWRTHRQRLPARLTASGAWRGGGRNPARARCSRRT
jgi:hypothetical protein